MTAYLSQETKLSTAVTPTAGVAGTADINGTTLDMAGWDAVLILVRFGAITAGAVTSIKAQQGAASNLSDAADLEDTGVTVADTDDDGVKYLDIRDPAERYVRLVVDRATQNAVVASAEYIQYRGREFPSTHGSGVAGESHYRPDEGTA